MTFNWADAMILVAILMFLAILAHGAINFAPHRARNLKYVEEMQALKVAEHIVDVQRSHPEIVRVDRIDRHDWFLVPHLCVLGYTICVFLGAPLTSNVIALGSTARYTMATCFVIGALLVLTGATLGAHIGSWVVKRDVAEHLTASVLGDDIVLPYRVSMAGMGAMMVSSSIYAGTSFQSTSGSLGGWLTGGVSLLCLLTIRKMFIAVARFQKWDDILITAAKIRAGIGDDRDAR